MTRFAKPSSDTMCALLNFRTDSAVVKDDTRLGPLDMEMEPSLFSSLGQTSASTYGDSQQARNKATPIANALSAKRTSFG